MGLSPIDLATLERGVAGPERERLRQAACAAGVFAITGYGISQTVTDALLGACRTFFALPQAERDAIDMVHSPYFRGYSAPGTEQTQGQPDMREQFDVGPEETPHSLLPGEPPWLRLHGPNLWPAAQPELRSAILTWMAQSRAVATRVVAAIGQSIGLPHDAFGAGFSGAPHERLKVIRYPSAGRNQLQGVGEHSDSGFVTLIVDDGSRGLQLEDGDSFVDANAPAGSMIVVLGRALHDATGGRTHAVRHRVVSPAENRERISVAYFLNPRLDYDGYGNEALRVVLRSHPQTAQRYFADLLPTS
jgi:isopenicillin N synthase-like dioxygenase